MPCYKVVYYTNVQGSYLYFRHEAVVVAKNKRRALELFADNVDHQQVVDYDDPEKLKTQEGVIFSSPGYIVSWSGCRVKRRFPPSPSAPKAEGK